MALLRTFFQRWQLRHAGADASDEALQADLHAPVVCVVPAREVEDAAEARSASGSSHDHAKTNSALLQPSEVAMLADEILQLSKATAPRGMVSPNDARKLAWDWLVVCFVVYTTLATPLDLAFFDSECSQTSTAASQAPAASLFLPLTRTCRGFNTEPALWASYEEHRFSLRTACKPAVLDALDNLVDAVFWLDIVLTFCTGIARERECLINYRRIAVAQAYVFRGTFVVDVLSALPLGALGRAFGGGTGADGALALKLLRLPRLLRLSRLLRKLENMSSATMFRVGLLVNAYVLIGHWAACIFFYLSKWQLWHSASGWASNSAGLQPWIVKECLQFENTPTRYTVALYWAMTTMATVGFGDVTPGTNLERCFAMAVQLVAGVLQGVVFGNIGVAMAGFDRDASKVKSRVVEANALARATSMPAELSGRLAAAAAAQAEAVRGLVADEALRDLAGGLLVEAEAAATGPRTLAAAPLFDNVRQPLPRGFVHAVTRQMRVMALPAGELATAAGDPDGAAMLLFRGACVRVASKAGSLGCSGDTATTMSALYYPGAMFGEAEAVLCRRSAAHVFAAEPSTLLTVSRASLDAALEDYPEALTPLTAACLAAETQEADAQATEEATKLVLERCELRKSARLGSRDQTRTSSSSGGSSGSGRSSGGAILDSAVPMLASLRSSGVGQAALRGGGSPGTATAAASRRWGRAGAAARVVVRLAADAHERAAATMAPDALDGADWSGFNARLRAVVSAQAAAFEACNARVDSVTRQSASI